MDVVKGFSSCHMVAKLIKEKTAPNNVSILSGVSLFRSSTHSADCQSILFNKVATFSFPLHVRLVLLFCSGRINKEN